MERAPQELLPIIPPSVARLLVAVSGPSRRPKRGAADRLPGQARPATARQHRNARVRAQAQRGGNIVSVARQNHADGQDLVDAGVRAVEDAGEGGGAHRDAAPPVAPPPPAMDRRRLLGVTLGHFLNDFHMSWLSPLLPLFVPRFHLSLALAGLLGTILNTSSALSQPLFGLAADRLSRSHLVALGPVLTVIAMSLTGVLPTYPALIAALLCAGIGTAIFHPQGAATAGFHGGDRRAAGLAIFVTGGELPYALGPLYIPALGQGGGA